MVSRLERAQDLLEILAGQETYACVGTNFISPVHQNRGNRQDQLQTARSQLYQNARQQLKAHIFSISQALHNHSRAISRIM